MHAFHALHERPAGPAPRSRGGFTLIEIMVAMALVLIGAVGLISLQNTGVRMTADSRRLTRATAIAQDLLNQIELWSFNDPRLANDNAANDADVGDTALAFEADGTTPADHDDDDLGADFPGISHADVAAAGYERYWSVSDKDPLTHPNLLDYNRNGVADGMRVAVIVRWQQLGAWRRVVLVGFKRNPAELQ